MRVFTSQGKKNLVLTTFVTVATFLVVANGNAAYLFTEDFSDNSAGWTLGSEWQIGPAMSSAGQSAGNPDPGLDHTPTGDNGVAGVVIGGNASTTVHPYYFLTSPTIDLSGQGSNLSLEFYRWLNSDYTPYMQNTIEVFDGTSWQPIWQTGPQPGVQDSAWTFQTFDISSYANSNFQARFGFNVGSSGVYTVSSWNLDDVGIHNNLNAVPIPSSFLLFGTGLAGIVGWRKFGKNML